MQSQPSKIIVLGTGGTIAGTAASAADATGYTAAQIGIEALVGAITAPLSLAIETEQVAQLDSKDMDHATWLRLAQRVTHHLARADVAGIVVTHGTDTLEETAYFLQRVLAPAKPVVLTGAMRPATSLQADGPQNLLDAVAVARAPGARGVVVVFAGRVFHGGEVRKVHPYRLDAFDSGDAGPIGCIAAGEVRRFRDWPRGHGVGIDALPGDPADWPAVAIVASHAGASGAVVRALCAGGVRGIVVAATGNGTVHRELGAALIDAQERGVAVSIATRCVLGSRVGPSDAEAQRSADLTPMTARIELMLSLLRPA